MKSKQEHIKRLCEPGVGIHLFFMVLFALAALYFKQYLLAAAEGGVILVLLVYALIARRAREKQLSAYIESVAYETENAKNNTLMHFPLPIAVFRLDDASIVWGNEMFFSMCGVSQKAAWMPGSPTWCRISPASGCWRARTAIPALELGGRSTSSTAI